MTPVFRNCTWTIKAPLGNSVNLTFSHFEMESHYGTGNCSYDYLAVTEGGGASLWRGCGEEIPATISSISDTVRVHFQSDYSVAHNGFRLGRTANIHVILIRGIKDVYSQPTYIHFSTISFSFIPTS